jgi:hypothetical protein
MFNIFKKKKIYPPFDFLAGFDKADLYFIRTASWKWLDNRNISVIDPHGPTVFTLDPWPQIIFLAANGNKSIKEYVFYVADQYTRSIPDNLDTTIIGEIETLIKYRIIKLSETQIHPEKEFDQPLK